MKTKTYRLVDEEGYFNADEEAVELWENWAQDGVYRGQIVEGDLVTMCGSAHLLLKYNRARINEFKFFEFVPEARDLSAEVSAIMGDDELLSALKEELMK